jgi:hypothetical protein
MSTFRPPLSTCSTPSPATHTPPAVRRETRLIFLGFQGSVVGFLEVAATSFMVGLMTLERLYLGLRRLERASVVLHHRSGREGEQGCCVVLPNAETSCKNIKVRLQPCPVHPLSQLICRCMCCFCKTICPFETWRMLHSFSSPQIESGEMPFILFRRLCMFKINCVYSFGEVGLVCW